MLGYLSLFQEGIVSSPFKSFLQLIYVLLLFLVIIIGAFYTTKLVAKNQMKRMQKSNMKIVDSMGIGPQKSILLVQVGSEYILIGVSKDRISLLKEISKEDLDLDLLNHHQTLPSIPFSKVLQKIQNKKDNGIHDEK